MPAASYREGPDGHSSRKQNSKRRRAKCSPSFVSGDDSVVALRYAVPRRVAGMAASARRAGMILHAALDTCSSAAPYPYQQSLAATNHSAVSPCAGGGVPAMLGNKTRSQQTLPRRACVSAILVSSVRPSLTNGIIVPGDS